MSVNVILKSPLKGKGPYFTRVTRDSDPHTSSVKAAPFYGYLKGLGHAILGNFSTDRMVIELTKISK